PARRSGAVLPRDWRGDRRADRNRDVAPRARAEPRDQDHWKNRIMTRPLIHEDSTLPIHAYLDGELDPTNALAVEKRMATNPALAAECERVEALQRLVREHLPREAPPPGLRTGIETAAGMRRPPPRFANTQFSW